MLQAPMIKQVIAVMIGGGLGSLTRFSISYWVQKVTQNVYFPWGILMANLIGCFGMGIVFGILFERYDLGPVWRAGIIIGFFGGLTTFSSFSLDTITLLQATEYIAAVGNIILNVVGCLLATFIGLGLVRLVI